MSIAPDRLFALLPAVYRRRDAEQGGPLRDLLRVIAEQVEVVEDDIARLYDNWFVETADEWAVAYLGQLVGHRPVAEVGLAPAPSTPRDLARQAVLVPRRDVAGTLGHARRKGTLALLEELAADIAGWPGRAVETARLLRWAQAVNHLRPDRGRLVDVRDVDALERLGGPFDGLAHSVDVRRITSHRTTGRHNLPEIALFVWRLGAYPVTRGPAYLAEQAGRNCFTFSVLGNDAPLFAAPVPEPDATHIAEETNVPAPIRRRALEERAPGSARSAPAHASSRYYGEDRSIAVWAPGWPAAGAPQPVPAERVVPADLTGWRYRPRPGTVALDPVLGRLMFPARQPPPRGVRVSHRYGFSADLGGGEYERPRPGPSPWSLAAIGPADVPDTAKLLERLGQEDPLARYLLSRWSDVNRRRLNRWAGPPAVPPPDLVAALTGELDLALGDDGLFDTERFPGASPALEAAALEQPSGLRLALTNRRLLESALPGLLAVSSWARKARTGAQLRLALAEWRQDKPRRAVIELDATEVYSTRVDVDLAEGQELVLRAGPGTRPVLWLLDRDADRPDSLDVTLAPGAKVVLEGLLVTGRAVRVSGGAAPTDPEGPGGPDEDGDGDGYVDDDDFVDDGGEREPAAAGVANCPAITQVVVRHCTLVPGWTIHPDCEPDSPNEPSLELADLGGACVTVEHSILGPIEVSADADAADPLCLQLSDSVLDATADDRLALRAPGGAFAHAELTAARVTVFGSMLVHSVPAAENSIFTGTLTSARRQHGCVRFCWVPAGSRTPRRFACQPDLVEAGLRAAAGPVADPPPEAAERERDRARPRFTSVRYGRPAYAQLALTCATEIVRGADDESELGAFHDLYQPQRTAALAVRLDEHTAAGMDAGIVFVT